MMFDGFHESHKIGKYENAHCLKGFIELQLVLTNYIKWDTSCPTYET